MKIIQGGIDERELEIFVKNFVTGDWLWEASPYWQEDSEIPIGVAVWFLSALIKKHILGEIPSDVYGFYCPTHKRAYLEKTDKKYGSGCDKCPTNNIWGNEAESMEC